MQQVKAGVDVDDMGEPLNNVEKVLQKVGISLRDTTGDFRDIGEVINEVGNRWEEFDNVQQRQIATAMAGTHQINTFIATMDNYGKVTEYTAKAMNSAGTAQEKYGAYMDSIQAHLNQLTTTWQEFVLNLDQSGTFNSVIKAAENFIKVLDTLLNKFGLFDKLGLPVLFASIAGVLTSKLGTALTGIISNVTTFISAVKSSGSVLSALGSSAQVAAAGVSTLSLGISAVVGVLSFAIIAIQNHNAELERNLQLARDNAQIYADESESLNSLTYEYIELNKKLEENSMNSEEVSSIKNELANVQERLNSLYGDEKLNIDLVNGSYQEQINKLKELSAEEARRFLTKENKSGYEQAKEYNYSKVGETYLFEPDDLNIDSSALSALKDRLKKELSEVAEVSFSDTFGDGFLLGLTYIEQNAEETLNRFRNIIEQTQSETGADMSNIINDIQTSFSSIDFDAIAANSQLILQYEQAQIMANTQLGEKYHELLLAINEYNEAILSGDPEKIEEAKIKLDETQASMTEFAEEYPVVYEDAINNIIEVADTAQEEVQNTAEGTTDELANTAENIDLSGIIEALEDVEDTDIDSDIFEDLVDAADDAGVSFEDLIDKMVEIGKITPEVGNKIKSAFFHTSILKELQQDIQNTIGQMAAFDSNWDILTSAVEEFNQAGSLSAATLQSLTDNNLLQYLQLTSNGLEINRQAFLNDAEAVKAKAIEDVKAEAFIKLHTLATENNTVAQSNAAAQSAGTQTAINNMAVAFANAVPDVNSLTTALAAYMSVSGSSYTGNMREAQSIINDMNNKIKIIQNTTYKAASAVGSVASGARSAAGGLGSAADNARKLKEELEDAQDAINDYIDMVADMIKQELEDQKDALEDEKDALEDKKDAALDAIDEEAEAMDRYYEDLRDQMDREKELADRNFEDRKEQLENLKDKQDEMFEDQKEALEDELDAYEEKIEAEKELLKQKEEERKYEQDLADKVKDVAKIQSELAALQFDDSIEAQKKKIELTEELAERQEELDEFQAEHSSELKEDALDKELERYEKSHEEKIKDIEEQQAAYEKMIDAQISALEQEQKAYERAHEDKLYALEEEQKAFERNIEDQKADIEDRYEEEKKKIEEKIEAVSDAMDKEGEIIQEAIRRIEEDADGTYQALLEWNRQYGSGINESLFPLYSNMH